MSTFSLTILSVFNIDDIEFDEIVHHLYGVNNVEQIFMDVHVCLFFLKSR